MQTKKGVVIMIDRLMKYICVSKKVLFLIAGVIWSFAGFRVLTIGIGDVQISSHNWILAILAAAVIFYLFFNFIFSKMHNKHAKRIINSTLNKHCPFSFFDLKSYLIMGFMITFGITIRAIGILNPFYIGTFYMGLGLALFMAGVLFLRSFIKFEVIKAKFTM